MIEINLIKYIKKHLIIVIFRSKISVIKNKCDSSSL